MICVLGGMVLGGGVVLAILPMLPACGCTNTIRMAPQSALRNGLAAALTIAMEGDEFSQVSNVTLTRIEPAFRFTTNPSTDRDVVSWNVSNYTTPLGETFPDAVWSAAALQGDGEKCWYIRQIHISDVMDETFYGEGSSSSLCTGEAARQLATFREC